MRKSQSSSLKLKGHESEVVELDDFSFEGNYSSHGIGVGNKISPERLLNLAVDHKFKHVVQSSTEDHQRQILSSQIMLEKPKIFFKYPLSTIVKPDSTNSSTEKALTKIQIKFKNFEQKSAALEKLVVALSESSKDQSLILDVKLVADELMCNALYNAPSPEAKNNLKVKLVPKSTKQASIFMSSTEQEIIIGCSDTYGSLNIIKLLNRVRDCFKNSTGAGISNVGNQGAGLGTFMVFSLCNSMYFAVNQNLQTIICCSIPRRERLRNKSAMSKTLHLILPD